MIRMHRRGRIVATAVATVALAAGLPAVPSPAYADTASVSLTVVTPDPDSPLTLCTTTFDIDVDFVDRPLVTETAVATVHSTGCGPVTWAAMVVLNDSSSPHLPWYARDGGPVYDNPATVSVSQEVLFGVVERPAAAITIHFEATSRLGHLCIEARTEYDITWTERPLVPRLCAE